MPKTRKKEPEKGFDYAKFTIMFSKLCIKITKIIVTLSLHLLLYIYKKILVWLAWRQLKKNMKDCITCKDYERLITDVNEFFELEEEKISED
jgi:hypothetical protein